MNKKWSELTQQEKIHYIISLVFAAAGLVCIVLDVCTEWKYAHLCWSITFGLFLLMECKANWNKSRKIAIIDLVLAIVLVGQNILTMIL